MSSFTLDDIRKSAEAKYGSTDIQLGDGSTCRLLNPLRLPKDKRTELIALQEAQSEDGADTEELLAASLILVADNAKIAGKLIKEIGGDLTVLAEIFDRYNTGAQVGEASPSQD
ncbi:phage tail assembly protein [Kribbella sp. NBC_01505]|uniref:phage tail assembly protein n=1 Tax=Kribbella sp. NBC_01505 TaxID=2903580 RepID=UPI0038709C81